MAALSDRQQQYIWLMGSHPDKIAVQGRGRRTPELRWGIDGDELVLFGYSTPLLWLGRRGLVRKLDNANAYVLTDAGEAEYGRLLLGGAGHRIGLVLKRVGVAPTRGASPGCAPTDMLANFTVRRIFNDLKLSLFVDLERKDACLTITYARRLVARHGDQVALWEVCTPEKAEAYLNKPAGQHATLIEHLEHVLRHNPRALDEEIPA